MDSSIEKTIEKNGTPSFAFLADVHWRGSRPVCRTDDFVSAQVKKMGFVAEICSSYKLKLLIAGDFFDRWNPSIPTISNAISCLPKETLIIPGQHDLPNHDIKSIGSSALSVLDWFDDTEIAHNPFQEMYLTEEEGARIGMYHGLVYYKTVPWKGFDGISSHILKKEFPDRDIIICGDNHKPFIDKSNKGPIIVNCGSIMRTTADQKDHKPCFYLYYEEANHVESIPLPIENGVISDEHIRKKEKEDADFTAFVEGMNVESESLGLDFKKNARRIIAENGISKEVKDNFWKIIGEAENE